MKAAYEKNSVSAAPDFCKQLTAQIQPEHQFGVELLGPKEENACLVMLNESGRLNATLCVLFILQMGGALLWSLVLADPQKGSSLSTMSG